MDRYNLVDVVSGSLFSQIQPCQSQSAPIKNRSDSFNFAFRCFFYTFERNQHFVNILEIGGRRVSIFIHIRMFSVAVSTNWNAFFPYLRKAVLISIWCRFIGFSIGDNKNIYFGWLAFAFTYYLLSVRTFIGIAVEIQLNLIESQNRAEFST